MARILEVDSMCVAVTYIEGKFVISSNYGSVNMSPSARKSIYDKLNKSLVPKVLKHLSKFKTYGDERATKSLEILDLVVPEYVSHIWKHSTKAKNIMAKIDLPMLKDITKFCYDSNNKISDLIKRHEDNVDDIVYQFSEVLRHMSKTFSVFKEVGTNKKKQEEVCDFIHHIHRLCRDLKKLENSVTSEDPSKLLPADVLEAIESKSGSISDLYEMVANDHFVHTESALLNHILINFRTIPKLHLGVSRICCPLCTLFVQAINHSLNEGSFIYTHGSHQNTPGSWVFPEKLIQDKKLLAIFLGGKKSKTYNIFVQMSEKEKPIALKLLQEMNKQNLNKHPELQELCQILIKPKSQYSLPEPSLTYVSERLISAEVGDEENVDRQL
jgi:hypothetical protein